MNVLADNEAITFCRDHAADNKTDSILSIFVHHLAFYNKIGSL